MNFTEKDFCFPVGEEILSARSLLPENKSKVEVLFLHGAGQATKERARPIADWLARNGCGSLSFDFSGHGGSTGRIAESSLAKRTSEAGEALRLDVMSEAPSLCAFSMGAHIALELIRQNQIHSLILFYPAVYASEAFDVPFGRSRFTQIIRQQNSWRSSGALVNLHTFKGNLLIITGEEDRVIPKDVIKLIELNSVSSSRKEVICIQNAPHLLLPTLYQRREMFDQVCATILSFVKE